MNKEDMNWKESKEGYMGMFRRRQGREKLWNYIKVSKTKKHETERGKGSYKRN